MLLKTFEEWEKDGYGVIKGQHACHRENGKCYFNETQVVSFKRLKKEARDRAELFFKRQEDIHEIKMQLPSMMVPGAIDRVTKTQAYAELAVWGTDIIRKHHDGGNVDVLTTANIINGIERFDDEDYFAM
jgi:hypothetical protein